MFRGRTDPRKLAAEPGIQFHRARPPHPRAVAFLPDGVRLATEASIRNVIAWSPLVLRLELGLVTLVRFARGLEFRIGFVPIYTRKCLSYGIQEVRLIQCLERDVLVPLFERHLSD